MPDGL